MEEVRSKAALVRFLAEESNLRIKSRAFALFRPAAKCECSVSSQGGNVSAHYRAIMAAHGFGNEEQEASKFMGKRHKRGKTAQHGERDSVGALGEAAGPSNITSADRGQTYRADVIVNCALAEYTAARSELAAYNNRLDRMLLIYLSALFTFVGFFFGTDTSIESFKALATILQTDVVAKSLVLFVTTLQAFLILIVVSYQHNIYRLAKYTSTHLRHRIAEAAEISESLVLTFDVTRNPETKLMLMVRGAVATAWFAVVTLLNASILFWVNRDFNRSSLIMSFLLLVTVLANAGAVGAAVQLSATWNDDVFDSIEMSQSVGRTIGYRFGLGFLIGLVFYGAFSIILPILLHT